MACQVDPTLEEVDPEPDEDEDGDRENLLEIAGEASVFEEVICNTNSDQKQNHSGHSSLH